jgi:K319L-like, PKD domain
MLLWPRRVTAAVLIVCIPWLLGGCGGGGGGGASNVPPTVQLSADAGNVDFGTATVLRWSSSNATSCTASDGWSGSQGTSGTFQTPALQTTTTFALSCSGSAGAAQTSVTITVRRVTLAASVSFARTGGVFGLTWSGTNVTACDASGGWSGTRPTGGTENVGPIAQNTTYTLTCRNDGGLQSTASVTVLFRAGVNVAPRAHAGFDQRVVATRTAQLDSSLSSDDAAIASRSWAQTAGPAVTLSDAGAVQPTFVAPGLTAQSVLTFQLAVTDDEGATATDSVDVTVDPAPASVHVLGSVSYELVPHGLPGTGLSYGAMSYVPLDADVLVEVVDVASNTVLASSNTTLNFDFEVPSQRDVAVRVTAAMVRQAPLPLPHWNISVRDLDAAGGPVGAIYSYTAPMFNTGVDWTHTDVRIPSGWSTSGQLTGERSAAPFAILAAVQRGLALVTGVLPDADFPRLTIDWSPTNDGEATFFHADANDSLRRIVLAGEADVDTQEYDPAVILHEFGHYIDHTFGRSDSIGGRHSLGDRVDMRVAFGEGFASALGAIARQDSVYRDSFGAGQHNSGFVDIERDRSDEGWYSESSVQELVWDMYDTSSQAIEPADLVELNFAPLWRVLHGAQRDTTAMTSVFTFMTALKQENPAEVASIDAQLQAEDIVGLTMDAYGSTETHNAGSADGLPIYRDIALGSTVQVRSTNEFGVGNKLSSHRFLRLNLAEPASVRFDVSAAAGKDPDIEVFLRGRPLAASMGPANENFALTLGAGEYILDVYDCGNADCNDNVTAGPTDITVSVTPN